MTLLIRLLGGFSAEFNGSPLPTPGHTDLVRLWSYLLLFNQRLISRDQLAFTLWPELDESDARARLRRNLHRLRQILPPAARPWLLEENRALRWNPEGDYWLDIETFRRPPPLTQVALTLSTGLYRDTLLPELSDAWLEPERARLHQDYCDRLDHLVEVALVERDYPLAQTAAAQRLRAEPHSESALRQLMALRGQGGDRAGALQLLVDFQARAGAPRSGTPLSAPTLALRNALLRGEAIFPLRETITPPEPAPLPATSPPSAPAPRVPRSPFPHALRRVLPVFVLLLLGIGILAHYRPFSPRQTLTITGADVQSTWITSSPVDFNAQWLWVDLHDGRGAVPPEVPLHQYPLARLNLAGSTVTDALLLFDLTALPKNSRVETAYLQIYLDQDTAWGTGTRLPPVTLAAYRLLRAWDPATTTFTTPWIEPGLRPGEDYDPTPLAEQTILAPGFVPFDVRAAFPAWQTENYGVVFMVTSASGGASPYWLVTPHHPTADWWPQLVIQYR
jgi:DNA-binding SARP family transcriptional activator